MKTLTDMATEKEQEQEKAALDNASSQTAQKMAAAPDNASSQIAQKRAAPPRVQGFLRKYDIEQLEDYVVELAARVEALEKLQAQVTDIQRRLADLEAAVSQIQGLTQDAVAQSVEKALNAVKEQVQPLAKELAKTMLLVSEALKKTNTQRI
jgi:predicted  nucleic acid-binding Zn-ribbon protein